MCSILGYCGKGADEQALRNALLKTRSRGPDGSRLLDIGAGWLGFNRLSIMGLTEEGMQPFLLNDCAVVCNGEIYGFAALRENLMKKGYTFRSGSDCEILLPLYFEYGTECFGMIDAEYACVLYDGRTDEWIAARDPIGIRPLYYAYDGSGQIIFASEPKSLMPLTSGKIMPFPPGHYYRQGEFIPYCDIAQPETVRTGDLDSICANIRQKLIRGVEKRLVADAKVGFLLSGGLDSSLVCSIAASRSGKPIRTFAIGMETDPIDLKYARQTADFLGADHTEVMMTREDVLEALPEVIHLLATYDITTIRASIGMYLVCRAIHETTDIRVILTGEVSDEIFGYKYTDFAPSAEAFQEEAQKRVRELHMYDVLRADRCISVNSLEARVPFGDLDFVRYCMSIDPEMKRNHYNKGKYLLRRAFEGRNYLPDEILFREKAAFSDAVGHSLVDYLKERAEEMYTDGEFRERCLRYDHARPFTKESLMYREIFESFYPGQSQMVRDFWMPNREWEGCNVDDPSARVLANYGASGT